MFIAWQIVGNLAEKGESLEYIKQFSAETTAQIG